MLDWVLATHWWMFHQIPITILYPFVHLSLYGSHRLVLLTISKGWVMRGGREGWHRRF